MILINASSNKTARIFQEFYPIHPPVGVGFLISYAEREGIKMTHLDQQVEEDIMSKLPALVKNTKPPYMFGFSVLTTGLKPAIELSQQVRKAYPDSFIIFGGIHPTVMPEEILAYKHIDLVVRGDGEKPLMELYRCMKEGRDYTHIENLSYINKDGKIVHNPYGSLDKTLDNLPPFPYHLFTHKSYDLGFILSSRGCPYKCTFCSCITFPGSTLYRYLSNKLIVDQLEVLYKQHNQKTVLFVDDNFLVGRKRIYDLVEKIKERGLANKMNFTFQARGDGIDYDLLKAMRAVGFNYVLFGLETANEDVMVNIKKGETVLENIDGVKMVKQLGYSAAATFIFGLPGEKHEDRMRCIELNSEMGLDIVRYNNIIPYPGTEMYEQAKKENRLTVQGLYENFMAVSAITENPFNKVPLAYVSLGNTEAQIKRDVLLASFIAYLNIPKMLKTIGGSSSKEAKWFNIGNDFFEFMSKVPALAYLGTMFFIKFIELGYYILIKKETKLSLGYLIKFLYNLNAKKNTGYQFKEGEKVLSLANK